MSVPKYSETCQDTAYESERRRLVALCARLTGNRQVAEDLAQETLLEAFRHRQDLRNPDKQAHWLSGIARNVCLRWKRRAARDRALVPAAAPSMLDLESVTPDGTDVEAQIEQADLVELLQRAMAMLAPESRRLLIQHYVKDLPVAAVARRNGLSAGAAGMKLQRGRKALENILVSRFAGEMIDQGLITEDEAGWQETRIWCPLCGRHRLSGVLDGVTGELALRCLGCTPTPGTYVSQTVSPTIVGGAARSIKAAYTRHLRWASEYYRGSLRRGEARCLTCGLAARLTIGPWTAADPALYGSVGLFVICPSCGPSATTRHSSLALALPEVQEFWRLHPRMRTLPEVEMADQAGILVRFEDVARGDRIDVVLDRTTADIRAVVA